MLIDNLTLHNFGVYKGKQTLDLHTTREKPVVLIGGLNGGGKTTLLDAVQLCLYGKLANCSNRRSLSYDEYLRRSINKDVNPSDGIGILLEFQTYIEGEVVHYGVERTYTISSSAIKEHFAIYKNDKIDSLLTDSWQTHVDIFIPPGIAPLFFFDGEKIESLADIENGSNIIKTSIQALLGVDLIDQLSSDLIILRKKKTLSKMGEDHRFQVNTLEKEIEVLKAQVISLDERTKDLNHLKDEITARISKIEVEAEKAGIVFYENRSKIKADREKAAEQLGNLEHELLKNTADLTPLLLVKNYLNEMMKIDMKEQEIGAILSFSKLLREKETELVRIIKKHVKNAKTASKIENDIRAKFRGKRENESEQLFLYLSKQDREELTRLVSRETIDHFVKNISDMLEAYEKYDNLIVTADRKLEAIPSESEIAHFYESLERSRYDLVKIEGQIKAITESRRERQIELDAKTRRFERFYEEMTSAGFALEDDKRIVLYSGKIGTVVNKFRHTVINANLQRIEQLVTDSFRTLLRKECLISKIRINTEYQIELYDDKNRYITTDRLSAGERQVLAISILWGLARASGRPLPTIIDTPLGRLDSSHRTHLVERYFPFASHQVILLSTDEEINQSYLQKIKPKINKAYRLEYKDKEGVTEIQPGYFW